MKFDKEIAARKAREEEEKLKGLSSKDKEEFKKMTTRLTGILLRFYPAEVLCLNVRIRSSII